MVESFQRFSDSLSKDFSTKDKDKPNLTYLNKPFLT